MNDRPLRIKKEFFDIRGNLFSEGHVPTTAVAPGIADLVYTVGIESVTTKFDDGSSVRYSRFPTSPAN